MAVNSIDDPYTVRCVRGCIFEVVLKSTLSPEELAVLVPAQPAHPKPPSKIGKAMALYVSPADRKAMAIKRLMRTCPSLCLLTLPDL